jgi:hypothetical protein
MKYVIITTLIFLAGCASNPDAKTLIETLEFGEDEIGCFSINGTVAVGGNPFASSNVVVSLVKQKGDGAPDC